MIIVHTVIFRYLKYRFANYLLIYFNKELIKYSENNE